MGLGLVDFVDIDEHDLRLPDISLDDSQSISYKNKISMSDIVKTLTNSLPWFNLLPLLAPIGMSMTPIRISK